VTPLDELVARAAPSFLIRAPSQLLADRRRAEEASAAARGSSRPSTCGTSIHPRLRVAVAR